MKKFFFLFLPFLSLLALTACTSEYDKILNEASWAGKVGEGTFYATIEDTGATDAQTKVYADEQLRVLWNADDQITIFEKNTFNQPFRFTGEDGDNAGEFTKIPEDTYTTDGPVDHTYAVYPYSESTKISYDGVLALNLPTAQVYKEKSFGIGANTMVSVTDDKRLQFKNVGGYLSFKFYGDGVMVKSIVLKGNNHEKIAGAASVTMSVGGTPSVAMKETATEELTLICAEPVALGVASNHITEFWFVIPPTTFDQGFTVTVTDDRGGVFTQTTSKSITISRNTLSCMAPMEVVPNYGAFVPFEDDNFKAYCVENFDIDKDGEISMDEALLITDISVSTENIESLLGIEYFTNLRQLSCLGGGWDSTQQKGRGLLSKLDVSKNTALTHLRCGFNQLTSLDVSNNTELSWLVCSGNQLTSLDVSKNTKIDTLLCGQNQLTSLDLSKNSALIFLYCSWNNLSSLDLSRNSALVLVYCYNNQLTSLDVSKNTALTSLWCWGNYQLTNLDVSQNVALVDFDCAPNQLTSLDVSKNTALKRLECSRNQLTSLDVSKNTALTELSCYSNQLTSLDVSNNEVLSYLRCDDNPVLTEIWCKMDQHFTLKYDNSVATVYFVDGVIEFSDANFKTYCVRSFDKDKDGEISMAEAADIKEIDVCTDDITSLQGIQFMKNLNTLYCSGSEPTGAIPSPPPTPSGKLNSLDVSRNTALTVLTCTNNQLESIDVSKNTALTSLDCSFNQITSLDISHNSALTRFYCAYNQLTNLDVSKNTALKWLNCLYNQLTSLDLSNNTALWDLGCDFNLLKSLELSNNAALTQLRCSNNQLTNLNLSNNTSLTMLDCGSNQLSELDVSKNTALSYLDCYANQLTNLDVSKNTSLDILNCDANLLIGLDVSNNLLLSQLICNDNRLTSLDVSNNANLSSLICNKNPYLNTIWLKTGQTIPTFKYDKNVANIRYKN